MKAMVFAAGLGTRLKPLTDNLPKALVPVCGRPLLYHVMTKLVSQGFDDIVINVHHFADKIVSYLASEEDFGVRVSVSDERDMLRETGGGIRHARQFLEDSGSFLVHNVDIVSDVDLRGFVLQCRPDALATLLVSRRETSRYLLFDEDMRLVGWTNVKSGEVRSPYPDLDVSSCRRLAFSGIHCMSSGVFKAMDSLDALAEAQGRPGLGERFPIMDFYLEAAARYPVYGQEAEGLHLVDVGKIQALQEAQALCGRLLESV